MGKFDTNVTKIVVETLKDETEIDYVDMENILQCNGQTILNWRNGTCKPNKSYVKDICQKIPLLLKNEKDRQKYLVKLRKKFASLGTNIKKELNMCDSIEETLKYIYTKMKVNVDMDKEYELFNEVEGQELLKDIIYQKFLINKEKSQIFDIKKFDPKEQIALQDVQVEWTLNLENCFTLSFRNKDKKCDYNVLVNYNFNQEDYEMSGDYTEARNAVDDYDVKMILLFGNANVPDNKVQFWMDYNIYMERIDMEEIRSRRKSKDYVYSTLKTDFELETIANQYADFIIGSLRKYFYVVFKNILFDEKKQLTVKQKDSLIFWDAKFATRHHINFQQKRIETLIDEDIIKERTALAIGYLSFPCMLRLASKYEKVYLMDNSSTVLKRYEKYVKEIMPEEVTKKLNFITFTSALSEKITQKYKLHSSLDFILIGTGTGSFIKRILRYYQICNLWLKDEGVLYISFLNKDFIYEYVDGVTAEQNFEFIPNIEGEYATALISNNVEKYDLYCRTWECNEFKDIAKKYFQYEKMYSYPISSVIFGTYKSKLQNLLKEIDKGFCDPGFIINNCNNSKGYFIDGVLRKKIGKGIEQFQPKILELKDEEIDNNYYLKTLILAEKTLGKIYESQTMLMQIYVIVLPINKKLPETTNHEIFIGNKKLRLLEISEINYLGLQYKNITPFLKSDGNIRLNCSYDIELKEKLNKYFYIRSSLDDKSYKIKGNDLVGLLKSYQYTDIDLSRE